MVGCGGVGERRRLWTCGARRAWIAMRLMWWVCGLCMLCVCVCVRVAADNNIGAAAGAAVAEALKLNSTLTSLDLECTCGRSVAGGLCRWWAGGTGWG